MSETSFRDKNNRNVEVLLTDGGNVPVEIQDQTSYPIEYYLTRKISDITITQNVPLESHYINLAPGHGFVIDDFIEVKYTDLGISRHFQAEVVSVNANVITIMPSVDGTINIDSIISAKRCTAAFHDSALASIDNPITFDISPVNGYEYDLTAITMVMVLGTAADDGLFGNLQRLTNGVYFGASTMVDGIEVKVYHAANVRDNSEFRSFCGPQNVVYTVRSGGGGSYGISAEKKFNGQENMGVVIRLSGENERFYVSVHNNLSGILRFRMSVRGHLVTG